MKEIQEEAVKRLEGIADEILEILAKSDVTMNEWAVVVAAIDKKTNIKINKANFHTILNL